MRLSAHFTLQQLTASETAERCGIDNTPPAAILGNLRALAEGLERVQSLLGHPLEISSGYRSRALNEAVGGSSNSQHCEGCAVDFSCARFGEPAAIACAIAGSAIAFDTLILEFGEWVHLSFAPAARRRMLSIYADGQGYRDGLWDGKGNALG